MCFSHNLIKNRDKDNRGSTLVTVLVAFFFLSILVTILLSTVVVNFRMRTTDRKAKDEFYYAEKALNDIYAGIGEDCALALGDAYSKTMALYKPDASGAYQDQIDAYNEFCVKYLNSIFSAPSSSNSFGLNLAPFNHDDLIAQLNKYVVADATGTKRARVTDIGGVYKYGSDKITPYIETNDPSLQKRNYPKIRYTILKDVRIVTIGNDGVVSGITTDIVIETPQVDFFTMNEKSLDYAIAAGEGIEFNDGARATIRGNVYGGSRATGKINSNPLIKLMTKNSDYGGILVNGADVNIDAEYVVSGGDIYVDSTASNAGHLTIKHDAKNEIWFDNLTIVGDKAIKESAGFDPSAPEEKINDVYVEGDMYAQGDFQLERNKSNVKLIGNYYGYGACKPDGSDGYISKAEKLVDENGDPLVNPSTRSSAVIINSKDSVVDMSGIESFVVLGKAYINHAMNSGDMPNRAKRDGKSVAEGANDVLLAPGEKNDEEIGESVAIKAGQEIFLMPTEFLNGNTNPTMYLDESFTMTVNEDEIKKWFGWKYLDHNEPVKVVKLVSNGVYRAYAYLNFSNEFDKYSENQREYIREVLGGADTYYHNPATGDDELIEPSQSTLKKKLIFLYKLQNSSITVGNPDSKVYSNGAIVEYSDTSVDDANYIANQNGIDRYAGYGDNMHTKYQYLCTYLDPLTNKSVSSGGVSGVNSGDFEDSELPFGKYFWVKGIRHAMPTNDYICSDAKYGDSKVIVIRGAGGDIFYNHDSAIDLYSIWNSCGKPAKAFIIIDGDAYIKAGTTIDITGFIYAKGEIIVEDGATLNVRYDSTLLDKRIEGELNDLEKDFINANKADKSSLIPSGKSEADIVREEYKEDTLIYYLLNVNTPTTGDRLNPKAENIVSNGVKTNPAIDGFRKYTISVQRDEIYDVKADYTQFMYFENWRKGL